MRRLVLVGAGRRRWRFSTTNERFTSEQVYAVDRAVSGSSKESRCLGKRDERG